MSPVQRPMSGPVLTFALEREMETVRKELASHPGHSARTLAKEDALRVVVIGMSPDDHIHPHTANGPISVQVVEGDIMFTAAGKSHALRVGDLLLLQGGVEHEVRSENGGFFLLTVATAA